MASIYTPNLMSVQAIARETADIKTFTLAFRDSGPRSEFTFQPGQFGLFSVFGQGEAPFGIINPPTRSLVIECSIKRAGKVTGAFHNLNVGDTVGFRGPYGRGFPMDELIGKNLIFVAGGIGIAPLRSLLLNCTDKRSDYGHISVIYGARSVADLVYRQELKEWQDKADIHITLTVDPGGENDQWRGSVGYVPSVVTQVSPSPENAMVMTCGPPVMIKYLLVSLSGLGFQPSQIITTLERKIKCGLGKCGRCNIGPYHVCKHGPVFNYQLLRQMPEE